MKTLRFRIVVKWLCFVVIGVSLLFSRPHPLLAVLYCFVISTVSGFTKPALHRAPRWFERLVYVLSLPAIFFFAVGLWFGFIEPWPQVARIGLWISLPVLLALSAYRDAKIWKLEGGAMRPDEALPSRCSQP
jgi:hypothetical protein